LTITLSAVLALSVVVFLLCRYAGLRLWHAAVCIVLGFYLASSSLAPRHQPGNHQPVPHALNGTRLMAERNTQ
jgi:hypothetical protein